MFKKITSAIFLLQFVFSSMAKYLTKLPKWDYLIKKTLSRNISAEVIF